MPFSAGLGGVRAQGGLEQPRAPLKGSFKGSFLRDPLGVLFWVDPLRVLFGGSFRGSFLGNPLRARGQG